jgi:thioredoxin reductase (NADPH)
MAEKPVPGAVYDMVIVGGGPAGFTAGLYAARAGFRVLLIEGASTLSQITVTDLIENYPGIPEGIGGFELMERFRKQAVQFGLETTSGDVTAVAAARRGDGDGWRITAGNDSYDALVVIVATGATWRRLGVPGEEAFLGKGVSNCATCDGPFYRGKDVAVVGGGDTAIQEALFLANIARKVTVVHRRDRLRAADILQKRAFAHAGIEFAWDSVVEEIRGTAFVEGLRLRNLKSPGAVNDLPVEGVFIFAGLTPNTEVFRNIVRLDEGGYIVADSMMQTSAKGVFACGDCISKLLRQVVTACGDGATAAFSAQLYIEALKGESY